MYRLADGSLSTDYKVGDEFEVVSEGYFHAGSVVKLLTDDKSDCPLLEIVCGDMKIDDKHYEYWSSLKPHRKQFTKADLKDGMVVTYRNKLERTILGGGLYDVKTDSAKRKNSLSSITNDMTDMCGDGNSSIDIIKVSYMNEVLWERKEETPNQKEIKRLRGVIDESQKTIDDAKKSIAALERDK